MNLNCIKKNFSLFSITGLFLLSSCGNPSTTKDKVPELHWIKIPGGNYLMGSPKGQGNRNEQPQHEENIQTLLVMKKEVTVQQFQHCVDEKVCWKTLDFNPEYCNYSNKEKINHPINCIDWNQANVFCTWIDSRLPTEAEWEYIASGGGQNIKYPWGNEPVSCDYAVLDTEEGKGCGKWSTWQGCSHPKGNNQFGVCDLAGNVFEWTSDWYFYNYNKNRRNDNLPPKIQIHNSREKAHHRVARGGGIGSDVSYSIRKRSRFPVDFSFAGLGVRCVR